MCANNIAELRQCIYIGADAHRVWHGEVAMKPTGKSGRGTTIINSRDRGDSHPESTAKSATDEKPKPVF